mmetsp:Transcript_11149/g.26177  ORF Transcript_11149/g.26177 Transcript_11149/m.26177 type:complete len:80 (+) Transcript_11149:556-795(+)
MRRRTGETARDLAAAWGHTAVLALLPQPKAPGMVLEAARVFKSLSGRSRNSGRQRSSRMGARELRSSRKESGRGGRSPE